MKKENKKGTVGVNTVRWVCDSMISNKSRDDGILASGGGGNLGSQLIVAVVVRGSQAREEEGRSGGQVAVKQLRWLRVPPAAVSRLPHPTCR